MGPFFKKIMHIGLIACIFMAGTAGCMQPAQIWDEPELGEGSRGLFYRVEGQESMAYLFGSVHLGRADMYPLHEAVYAAFEQSDMLGVEIDLAEMAEGAREMVRSGTYEHDGSMTDIVSVNTFEQAASIMEEHGFSREYILQLKPWLVANELAIISALQAGYELELGLENYFAQKARTRHMEILGLESPSDQIDPFGKLSDKSQAIYLKDALDELDKTEVFLKESISRWKEGDAQFFSQMRREQIEEAQTESLRQFYIAMYDGRDKKMAQAIHELLQHGGDKTYFLVVGTLHLAGENSIPHRLEQKGYEVRDMYSGP